MKPNRNTRVKKNKTRKPCRGTVGYMTSRIGWFNLSLLLVMVTSLFFYLVQVSGSVTKGFEVNKLQKEAYTYHESVRELERKVNDLKSVEYIAHQASQLEMVTVDTISFMPPLTSGVAMGN